MGPGTDRRKKIWSFEVDESPVPAVSNVCSPSTTVWWGEGKLSGWLPYLPLASFLSLNATVCSLFISYLLLYNISLQNKIIYNLL